MDEVYTLTKWLFLILDEVAEKIESKEIIFEGGNNVEVRERKLIEVTSEYQKKYRRYLQSELIEINRKERLSLIDIDYVKNFLYTMFLQYDKNMSSNSENSKQILYICHNIIMIYEATRLLKKCYD